jgi:hypothetical protein
MTNANAKNYLLNIFHFSEVSSNDEWGTCEASSPWIENKIKIDYFLESTIHISVEGGYSTAFDYSESKELFLQKCIWFIAENMKIFCNKNPNILAWGFNCNMAYVEDLWKSLQKQER